MITFLESLTAVRNRFKKWLFDEALPFWATTGCEGDSTDPARFGVQEYLTRSGKPALSPFKRVRVQARQLFVFSWAALQGWEEGVQRAQSICRFLLQARYSDHGVWHGCWGRQLSRKGGILETTADLYDLAFVIFALAWYGRLSNMLSYSDTSNEVISYAQKTLDWIERKMSHSEGGFLNCLPDEGKEWQQNPHMHLLEAVLALYHTTNNKEDLTWAHRLYTLFHTRFYDPQTGTLGEYFNHQWQPATGQFGQWIEPGHHFEWVWLLYAYQQVSGVEVHPYAEALYHFARRYGVDQQTGLVRSAVNRQGDSVKETFRLWGQSEALRGTLAYLAYTRAPKSERDFAITLGNNLLNRYLNHSPLGTWVEEYDHQGNNIADRIPTSSMYHIVTAYDSLNKAVQGCWKFL